MLDNVGGFQNSLDTGKTLGCRRGDTKEAVRADRRVE
jgi:hypothetical protein